MEGMTHLCSLRLERWGVWWGSVGKMGKRGARVKQATGRKRPETHTFK